LCNINSPVDFSPCVDERMSSWAFWWLVCVSYVAGIHALSEVDDRWKNSRSVAVSEVVPNQKVFILTLPRSGSSFVGEMFLQNPDFQYLFEPERGFSELFAKDACLASPADLDVEKVTKSLFNCDFSVLKNYTESHFWRGHIYSWERIATFSGKEKTKSCLPPNSALPAAQNMSVAIKEIEMWAPKLNWLHDTLGSDLHVIWLMRDVRGWVSSWLVKVGSQQSFYKDWGYDKIDLWSRYSKCEIIKCGLVLDDTKISTIRRLLTNSSSAPHLRMAAWWTLDTAVTHYYFSRFKGKVLLVKYEDMSSQPFDSVHQIYAFLNRPHVPEKVLRHLAWATKGGDVGNRYDTYRNSREMAAVWRTRLTQEQIKEIQDIAGVWFPYFGYNLV